MTISPKQIALELIISELDDIDFSKVLFRRKVSKDLPWEMKEKVINALDDVIGSLQSSLELQTEVDSWPELTPEFIKSIKVIDARTGKEMQYGLPDNPTTR